MEDKTDFINEKISISDYLTDLPPITETDFTKNLDYQQTEFKPTLFRYIRLMNKENIDKDGNKIYPYFEYDKKTDGGDYNFSSISYKYLGKEPDKKETIRRLQKTKLSSYSYPFGELVPSNTKKKKSDRDEEKKSKEKELDSKKEDKKKVLNLSQQRHYNVQNFSIIILCLIINAFCCIIYYTSDWPDVIKRLPNQISLSKVIINDSFIFTGDKLFVQNNDGLSKEAHNIVIKSLSYGNISIDASHMDSRVKCNTMHSNGNSLTIGFINFSSLKDQNAIQLSTPNNFKTISVNMDIDNVNLLDLSRATKIFGENNSVYSEAQLFDETQFSDSKKDKSKKTLLKRLVNSDRVIQNFYDNHHEIYYTKLFELKKDVLYALLFDNNTLSLVHVNSSTNSNQRPTIEGNINNFLIDWSIEISKNVKAADVTINSKIIYLGRKEVKFVYIANDNFNLHIGKIYFNDTECSKVIDFDLPKINLNYIYGSNTEEDLKIKLLIDSKGFPIITLNENHVINCRHPLCAFDQYP